MDKKLKISLLVALPVMLIGFHIIWYMSIGCVASQKLLLNYGAVFGGVFGPIITALTLLFIWIQSREDRIFSRRSVFFKEILSLFDVLDDIEVYYKENYQDALKMCELDGKFHSSNVSKEKAQEIKSKMDELSNKYKEFQSKKDKNIPKDIERSLTISKFIFGTDSLEYLIPYLEMAKSVDHKLKGILIGDSRNIFFDEFHYSFLKRSIYKDTFSKYLGDKKLLYDNWLDFAKTDLTIIKKKITSTRL